MGARLFRPFLELWVDLIQPELDRFGIPFIRPAFAKLKTIMHMMKLIHLRLVMRFLFKNLNQYQNLKAGS